MEKVAVIGIGRLGLCLALNLERAGYNVVGIDVSEEYVTSVNTREFKSTEPNVNEYLLAAKNFNATVIMEEIFRQDINILFVVVPTPSLNQGAFDHSFIDHIVNRLVEQGPQSQQKLLVINSTCMPGYSGSVEKKLSALNYAVLYSPEFIAQGSIIHDQQNPDQVLIGESNSNAGDRLLKVYERLCKSKPVYCRMSLTSAEITKLATNCFLTTKISFANAIGDLAIKTGAEPEKILAAIGADSRIGTKYLKYGFGYGGPCFPRDNKAFTSFAEANNYKMLISEATDLANEIHADYLLKQWQENYKDEEQIVFDSVTYKKGTDILEESQQLKLAVSLAKSGKKVMIEESSSVIKALIDMYGDLFIYKVHGK